MNRTLRKRVATLIPSPENQQLYRSSNDDPDIHKLAASIEKHGLQEPLVVTLDNFVVSGHRRLVALQLLGQVFVTCRVLPVRRDSMTADEYLTLLREHNRQRNKSAAEQLREELVDINPVESYARLREQRHQSLCAAETNGVAMLKIEGSKKRYKISGEKAEHVKYVTQVVFEDRQAYWPLSVRAVHYALLNYEFQRNTREKLPYKNDDQSYQATSNLLTRLRLNGELPWGSLDDGTRPLQEFHAFGNVREFIRQQVERDLLAGYWRNYLQTQPAHIEVACEKNSVFHMVLRVTQKYQIPTSSGRGFCGIDPWHDLHQRYVQSGKERLIVIVLSDYDPEGQQIVQVAGRTLRDDFKVWNLSIIKAAVTREQIEQYNLPAQNFAKESSSNLAWFVERNNGNTAVFELEALDPEDMMTDLDKVIRSIIDVDLFNRERVKEEEEAATLEAARRRAVAALKGLVE
jgi:hypothetical protein